MGNPKIKVNPTAFDKSMDIAAWLLLSVMWVFAIWALTKLPDRVPIHFNSSGQPDRMGSKAIILMLPFLASLLYVGLYYLNKVPHLHNYMVTITPENAEAQYRISTRVLRFVNLGLLLLFSIVMISICMGSSLSMAWLMPIIGLLFFVPTGYFIYLSNKRK